MGLQPLAEVRLHDDARIAAGEDAHRLLQQIALEQEAGVGIANRRERTDETRRLGFPDDARIVGAERNRVAGNGTAGECAPRRREEFRDARRGRRRQLFAEVEDEDAELIRGDEAVRGVARVGAIGLIGTGPRDVVARDVCETPRQRAAGLRELRADRGETRMVDVTDPAGTRVRTRECDAAVPLDPRAARSNRRRFERLGNRRNDDVDCAFLRFKAEDVNARCVAADG